MRRAVLNAGIFALLLLFAGAKSALCVEISEVCTSNDASYRDEYGNYPDWIELYNPDSETVDLSNCWISDDEEEPYLFCLSGLSLDPEAYLVLAADGQSLPFKLSATGCALYLTQEGSDTQSLTVPMLGQDKSFSRQSDGSYAITETTPGTGNAVGVPYVAPVYVASPRFSQAAGFYDEPFTLTMETFEGGTIYYTLDGSVPTTESTPYREPIYIDDFSFRRNTNSMLTDISTATVEPPKTLLPKCAIVRAIAVDADGNPSGAVSASYFVGYQNRGSFDGVSIMSVIVDPYDMFDSNDGIYMLGKGYADWLASEAYDPETPFYAIPFNFRMRGSAAEIPSSVQLFDAARVLCLDQNLGVRINGNISRQLAQKALKLYARKQYSGSGTIEHRFWSDSDKASRIVVKSAKENGAIAHALLRDRLPLTANATPCILFINGEYWGLYRIWACQDDQYIENYCGVAADNVVMIKNGELAEGKQADYALYQTLKDEVLDLTCISEEDYAYLDSMIDIDNYTDYLVGGLYLNNTDWINNGNNISLWRAREVGSEPYEDGRWRWIYQDMDVTCHNTQGLSSSLLKEKIFSALWTNEGYRTKFLTRVMDLANIDCCMSRANAVLDTYAAAYRPYLADSYQRFDEGHTVEGFDKTIEELRSYFETRQDALVEELTKTLRLDRAVHTLAIETRAESNAAITLNGHALSFEKSKWSGAYFERCPITLCAAEEPEYRFTGWFEDGALLSEDPSIAIEINEDRVLLAQYEARRAVFTIDANNAPEARDGALLLSSENGRYAAQFEVDPDLSATVDETGAVCLTANKAWAKGAYFQFVFDTASRNELRFTARLAADKDVAQRWSVECGTDGTSFRELDEIRLEDGENSYTLTLPDEYADRGTVYLRFCADKKGASQNGQIAICATLYAAQTETTLAGLRTCVSLCEAKLGDAFEAPDLDTLTDASQGEINALTNSLYEHLAAALVDAQTQRVEQAGLRSEKLEGMEAYLCVRVDPEVSATVARVPVTLDATRYVENAYVYQWTADDQLDFTEMLPVLDGAIALKADEGTYILLDRPADLLRCKITVRSEGLDADLLAQMLSGVSPEAYALVTVEQRTAYQDVMTIPLPAELARDADTVWLYALKDGALSSELCLRVNEDGAAEIEPLLDGEYLVLPLSLDGYRQAAEFETQRVESMRNAVDGEENPTKYLIAAAGGCALLLILIVVFVSVRRKRRARR